MFCCIRLPGPGHCIALAMFTPVLIWNERHGWVSFIYQSGRGFVYRGADAALHVGNVLVNAAGQAVWISLDLCAPGARRLAGAAGGAPA